MCAIGRIRRGIGIVVEVISPGGAGSDLQSSYFFWFSACAFLIALFVGNTVTVIKMSLNTERENTTQRIPSEFSNAFK
jgi:hypothetical protein